MVDPISILIVDGDATVRRTLRERLSPFGSKVIEAHDSNKALELFQSQSPQIIITDIDLPTLTAVDFTRRVSREAPHVLIAVMTAKATQQLIIDCLKAGASDFLEKPVDGEALRLVVSRFVDLLQRRQDKLFTPDCLEEAGLQLTLRTSRRAIAPAVSAVADLVRGHVTNRELQRIELALNEVVRNAYEHGNLGISFDEKATVCEAGSFEELLSKRSQFAQEQGKLIRIRARISAGVLTVTVEDEGAGFDWRSMLARNPLDSMTRLNGRGLFMIARAFDNLEFNDRGNSITLTKQL